MNWKKSRIIMSLMMLLILAGIGRIVYVDATAAKDKVVLLKSTTTADMIKTTESASEPEVTAVPATAAPEVTQTVTTVAPEVTQNVTTTLPDTTQAASTVIQYQRPCLRKRAKRSMPYGFILMKCIKKPKHIRYGKTILIVHLIHARRKK